MVRIVVALVVVVGVRPADAEPLAPRELTLPAAIEIALAHNPQLAIETQSIVAAEAKADADATLRMPLLAARANVFIWDRPIVADLGPDIGKITIRDRFTGTVDISLSQPVSGALVIGTLVERDRALAAGSRAQRDNVRVDIAYQTVETYLGALQAVTLQQVAQTTLQQLDGDLKHANAALEAGTLQRVDVLRLEAERARVEAQGLQAESSALGARRKLALLLGMPDGTELALVDVDTTPPPLPPSEDDIVARARRDRPDVRIADATTRAAELGVKISKANYYPSVSLTGIYSHTLTSSFGTAADSAYIGVSFDWNMWDWGKRGADVAGARALDRQAKLARAAVDDQIAVDVRTRWQAARTARATLDVSARGLAAAAEAQRLLAARFQQGAATTVEVLDAETSLANARSQAAIARYQYLVAWMSLGRATGTLPAQWGTK